MAVCSAKNCFNHDAKNSETALLEGITFHLFPKNPTVRARWINQMNDDTFAVNSQSTLCSLHFIKEFFVTDSRGVACLKPDAIPTEFEFEFDQGDNQEDNSIACCAFRCSNSSNSGPPITLHQFPIDQPDLCDQWLLAMNIAQVEADKAVLCSDHFDDSCFIIGDDGERHMMANAVPSIFVFPEPGEYEDEEESAPAENMEYYMESQQDVKPDTSKTNFTESALTQMQKHDDIVRSGCEEEQRLMQILSKRIKIDKKNKDLEFLIRIVLQGGHFDKESYARLKPFIDEVDSLILQIVSDCTAPCISLELNEDSQE